jgi:uncharacterized coiled-coil DUF342 family protein
LNQELEKLKSERDVLNQEAQRWAGKRDQLHEEIRKVRQEAQSFREKRDELNKEVQLLKAINDERRKQRQDKIEQLKEDRLKVREKLADKPSRSFRSLKDELDKIEWKIQTEPLSIEEERRLVSRVKSLETQLEVYRRVEAIRTRINKTEEEMNALRHDLLVDREKIQELAQKSQFFHEKMIVQLEKAKELKTKADKMHAKYMEYKEKAGAHHANCLDVLAQIKAFRAEIRKKEEAERIEQEANLRSQLEKRALEKLRNGKKLTFEEFQILAEQGKI